MDARVQIAALVALLGLAPLLPAVPQLPSVTWTVLNVSADPDRPGWSAYTSVHHDPVSGQTLFYQMRNTASNIYSTDFFALSGTNDFIRIGGTGSLTSATCSDGNASTIQPWPPDRHPVQQMAIDTTRNVLWLYNGVCSGVLKDDQWQLALNANPALDRWTRIDISTSIPGVRNNGGLVYSPDHDVLFLFGTHYISNFQETWVYCPSTTLSSTQLAAGCVTPGVWRRIYGSAETAQQPTLSKSGFPMVRYHRASRKVYAFLYAQTSGGASTHEVWTYDIPTRAWVNRAPSGAPNEPASCCPEQGVAYITSGAHAEKFLYHQTAHNNVGGAAADYLYDPVTNAWTLLATTGTSPRNLLYVTWDATLQRVVANSLDGFWTATLSGSGPPIPPTCTATLAPTSATIVAGGSSGNTVSVTLAAGCTWSATSSVPWVTITGGTPGTGNGTVTYTVAPNTSTSPRTGTLTIAGLSFTVTQSGTTPPPQPPPTGTLGRGCTTVWYIDEDCDGYGPGVRSTGVYGTIGLGDRPDADDLDATMNTPATVRAVYDVNSNGVLDPGELKAFLTARKHWTPTGRVFYIATTGSNATGLVNDPARPFATYNGPVWTALTPGDVVVYRAGTYTEPNIGGGFPPMKSGTATNPIGVISSPGEPVQFNTASSFSFDTVSSNYQIIDGFVIDNPTNSGFGTGYGCAGTTGTRISNIEVQRFNYISCIDNMHDLVMENLVHHHMAEHGLYMGARDNPSTNVTVRKSLFYLNGVAAEFGAYQYNGRVTNLLLEQNVMHSNGQWGISLKMGVSNSVFQNNLIFNNQGHGIIFDVYPGDCIGGTSGICPYTQTGNVIRRNTIWIGKFNLAGVVPPGNIPANAAAILVARNVGFEGDGKYDQGQNTYEDNIFVTFDGPTARFTSSALDPWMATSTFRTNIVYRLGAAGPNTDVAWRGASRYSFTQWQSATFPLVTGNVYTDPLFTAASINFWGTPQAFDFRLQPGSPATGKGYDFSGGPAPPPCTFGAWSAWVPITACTNNQLTEERTRTASAPGCLPVRETRIVSCTPPVPPPGGLANGRIRRRLR